MVRPAMRVGLISDTHGLLRSSALAALRGVHAIVHAGDVGAAEVLAALRTVAPVTAVAGNMDRRPLAQQLAATALLELDGHVIFALHDLARLELDPTAAGIEVVVHGHTHRPSITRDGGVLYVNPGSAGPVRDARPPSVGLLELGAAPAAARIVELDD